MLKKNRGQLRNFVNDGLVSWQEEDIKEGEDNSLWGKLAAEDFKEIKSKLSPEEKEAVAAVLTSLTLLPQQVANVPDKMLDMEGVRCKTSGKVMVFYRYNSSFDLVDIIRVAYGKKEWEELVKA